MMAATAKGLSDADMQDLARHYAALKIKAATAAAAHLDLAAGKARADFGGERFDDLPAGVVAQRAPDRGHDLLGILITQTVERERATLRNRDALGERGGA